MGSACDADARGFEVADVNRYAPAPLGFKLMMCPKLNELPSAPEGRIGFPWTEESSAPSSSLRDAATYPRISIVTPSYNQGRFLEETIRSVLLQNYSDLEYIVIDGGSTDESLEVIKKYSPWISYWVSEPDEGQTQAIQKGFERVTGVVWNWLNSDDYLEPNAVQTIAAAYLEDSSATTYSGKQKVFFDGIPETPYANENNRFEKVGDIICVWENWANPQPVIYMSSEACREVSGLNTSLRYVMDYELYLRLAMLPTFKARLIDSYFANFRLHRESKTCNQAIGFKREILRVFDDFAAKHLNMMPTGWQRSRARFEYHLQLDIEDKETVTSFLKVSSLHAPVIWNYRFFWAVLASRLMPHTRRDGNSSA
ncbi:MAG: glycosyltransferase [Pyrinomonadaceae bacterium MAG19_C2-C3]|nr:glycosyltransferase [Pyrinomonadaceae bacterium MAG19_C2-C3]